MQDFHSLGISPLLLQSIEAMGFTTPTEIQQKTIPVLLDKDIDIVALAQTGTGKTAAFGLPLLQKIDQSTKHTQAIILSPTRELCLQIVEELKQYAQQSPKINIVAIYGGADIREQARKVKQGAQILVATPGRMQDMLERNIINLSAIDYCVLDEADEMLNMGFKKNIFDIMSYMPDKKNTWLFSATMSKEVYQIAKGFMQSPLEITVGQKNTGAKNITHEYYVVSGRQRYDALKRLVDATPNMFGCVFCRTKRETQQIAENLIRDGYNAAALHGDLSQAQRDTVMKGFRAKQTKLLIATDVAARGIDVDDISHVIHYQLPDEIEVYTHRSGRTGRAGKAGVSMLLVAPTDKRKIRDIERIVKTSLVSKQIPTAQQICETRLMDVIASFKKVEVNEKFIPFMPSVHEQFSDLEKEVIIEKFVSMQLSSLYEYYDKNGDLKTNNHRERNSDAKSFGSKKDNIRFFLNVGEREAFKGWQELKDFLVDTLEVESSEIFHVDLMKNFSFFSTSPDLSEKVLQIINSYTLGGRQLKVEITEHKKKVNKNFPHSNNNRKWQQGGASSSNRARSYPRRSF